MATSTTENIENKRLQAALSDQLLGMERACNSRIQQARLHMDRAKLQYMKEQLLHQVLQRLAASHSTLSRRLGLAAAVHSLALSEEKEEDKTTILGIEERHLHQLASNTPEWQRERMCILTEVEEELSKEKELLGDGVSPEEMKEKMKLVDVMELDQIQLDQQLQNMRSKMFTLLQESCEELLSLSSEHHSVTEDNQLTTEYLLNKAHAMHYKLKAVKLQLMVASYTKDSNTALSRIRSLLESARQQLEEQVAECRHAVEHYSALSPEFVSMAQEYHKIKEECDEKRWAINELSKTRQPMS